MEHSSPFKDKKTTCDYLITEKNRKQNTSNSGLKLNRWSKIQYLLIPLLFCFFSVNAQVKKPAPPPPKPKTATPAQTTTTTTTEAPPIAYNNDQYKKTDRYAKRKAKYDKYSPGPQTKDVKFQDGTVLHIKLDKKSPDVISGPVQKKVGQPKKESSNGYDCTTNTINLTSTSNSFLNNDYSGSVSNIYPGACYTYANLTNGSWKEQTGVKNELQITTDNPNIRGNSYENVKDPSQGTLQTAVAKLFSRMPNSSATESLAYQVSDATNSATYNLQIGAAASGYGVDLSNVYSTGNQSNHVHLTIDATKTLFTISVSPPDSGFYKDPKIEQTPYLSYIGEVSYGVRVLANADLTFNSEEEADLFKASYSGYGVSVSLSVNYGSTSQSTTATINGYMIGGPGSQVVAYSLNDLKKQIEKAFANATFQNARPISYKAFSMAGDVLNTYSATDNFNVRTCVPADGGSPEIESVAVTFTQGNDGKEPATGYIVGLYTGTNNDFDFNNAMFVYDTNYPGSGNSGFPNNSTETIILKDNKYMINALTGKKMMRDYKGKFDLAALQKSGGHLFISPIFYKAGSTPGVNTDIWKIDNVSIAINLKPTPANPNPQPIGKNLTWNLMGANELILNSSQNVQGFFYFDSNFNAQGHQ